MTTDFHGLKLDVMSWWIVLLSSLWAFAAPPSNAKRIVIIGDSLTEGYGVSRERAFPSLVQKLADQHDKKWTVVNSGISGSTSASAPSRVSWQLKQKPDLIVLALGANDGLRGTPVKTIEKNLGEAIKLAQKAGVKVVLAGMQLPPNYGADYTRSFEAVYSHLAAKYGVPLIPFLLDNVGGEHGLNQADGIHPNEKGHAVIANTVFKAIEKAL